MAKGNMEDSGKPTHPRGLMKCFPFSRVPSLNHDKFCIAKIMKDYYEDPTFDIGYALIYIWIFIRRMSGNHESKTKI